MSPQIAMLGPPRMTPEVPAHCRSERLVRTTFKDTDLMGIVHHASYLGYFESGRVEYMRRRGIDYALSAVSGVHLAVVETGLRYRKPARFDELIRVDTRLVELSKVRVRFHYQLLRHESEQPLVLVEGFTLLACVSDGGKLRGLPTELRTRLLEAETCPRAIDLV
jgi:acyl-CoA thioester hydrolase